MNIRLILKRSAQLLLVPMFALLVGCNEKDPDTITVNGFVSETEGGEAISVLNVSSEGGKYLVYPSTSTWTVTSDKDWCMPQRSDCQSYDSDKSLELYIYGASYGEDSGADNRMAQLTFTSGAATYYVLVSQSNSESYVTLIPDSKTVGYEATTVSFAVITNSTYAVSSSQSWATLDTSVSMIVTATIEENMSETERVATFSIFSEGTTSVFTLTQEGRDPSYVAADIESYTFPSEAYTDGVNVKNVALTHNLTNPEFSITSTQDWCEVGTVYEDANGNKVFDITVSADNDSTIARDESTIHIVATAGDITVTDDITVTQAGTEGPSIVIGASAYTYGAAGDSDVTISYVAVGDVTAGASVDWITLGTVDETALTITFIDANTTGAERSGTITIVASKGGETASVTITITQESNPLTLAVSTESINVGSAGETITIEAATNGSLEWSYASASTWCTYSTETSSTITFTVAANTTGYERECVITAVATLGNETLVKAITVTQACDVYVQP